MSKYYIGVRQGHTYMSKLLDKPVGKLNGRLSDSLRTATKKLGIKKTEQGQPLQFYAVDKDTLDDLLDPAWLAMNKISTDYGCKPLVTVDSEVLSDNLNKVNSKYPSRMPRDRHKQYKAELADSIVKSVTVVGKDLTRSEILKKRSVI